MRHLRGVPSKEPLRSARFPATLQGMGHAPHTEQTTTVANRLCELMAAGKDLEAMDELYADDARHIEAMSMDGSSRVTEGKENLKAKMVEFMNSIEVHDGGVGKPFPHDDQFIVEMWMDCTFKEGPMAGQRYNMKEQGLYTVRDGKIAEAKFFYGNGDM